MTIRVHIIDENDTIHIGPSTIANEKKTDANLSLSAADIVILSLQIIFLFVIILSICFELVWNVKVRLMKKLLKAQVGLSSPLIADRFHKKLKFVNWFLKKYLFT